MKVAELQKAARQLGFTPQQQVRWLAPAELVRIGLQAGLAWAFSSFTDKRELQRALPIDRMTIDGDPDAGCWIDFLADTGDGFDATMTVALTVAQESLAVGPPGASTTPSGRTGARGGVEEAGGPDGGVRLPRGRMLVLGGDQVYPSASSTTYENRMKGPYRSALAEGDVHSGDEPTMVALPGNHDWYDGLTSFLRVFAQQRRIGGWRTEQTRSYFVVELPGNWWLVGLDTQLGAEIDDPQLDYFRLRLVANLSPGDGVILAVAGPVWIGTPNDPAAFDSLLYFQRHIIEPSGARVHLWITGDHHHYARYEEAPSPVAGPDVAAKPRTTDADGGQQFVTSGLGGAYLSDTHRLPSSLDLPPPDSAMVRPGQSRRYRLAARWPEADASRRIWRGLFLPVPGGLPYRNPGFFGLAGAVHAVGFLVLLGLLGLAIDMTPPQTLRAAEAGDAVALGVQALIWVLIVTLLASVLPALHRTRPRAVTAFAFVVVQLAVAVGTLVVTLWAVDLVTRWQPVSQLATEVLDYALLTGSVLLSGLIGGVVGSYGFALSLVVAGRWSRRVASWVAPARSIEQSKGFVRIHVARDKLRLYPIVMDDVCHDWQLQDVGDGMVRPVPDAPLPPVRLAEPPVTIRRTADVRA